MEIVPPSGVATFSRRNDTFAPSRRPKLSFATNRAMFAHGCAAHHVGVYRGARSSSDAATTAASCAARGRRVAVQALGRLHSARSPTVTLAAATRERCHSSSSNSMVRTMVQLATSHAPQVLASKRDGRGSGAPVPIDRCTANSISKQHVLHKWLWWWSRRQAANSHMIAAAAGQGSRAVARLLGKGKATLPSGPYQPLQQPYAGSGTLAVAYLHRYVSSGVVWADMGARPTGAMSPPGTPPPAVRVV